MGLFNRRKKRTEREVDAAIIGVVNRVWITAVNAPQTSHRSGPAYRKLKRDTFEQALSEVRAIIEGK